MLSNCKVLLRQNIYTNCCILKCDLKLSLQKNVRRYHIQQNTIINNTWRQNTSNKRILTRFASTSTNNETQTIFEKIIEKEEIKENIQTTQISDSSSVLDNIPEPPEPVINTILSDNIPEPPEPIINTILDTAQTIVNTGTGEPSFASIGLGGWSPVGIVENCLEYLHIDCGLPWWGAIAIGTVCVRIIIFPLVITAQRNAAKMNNNMPQLQALQLKMTEARQTGNQLDAARYGQEMMLFMKEKQLNPLKNMVVPLAQMPLFVSFFMGLREMSNVPVDSMHQGGLFWFTDLTMPDPYFLLPIVTSFTMWVTIEVGTDAARLSSQNLQTMRYVLRALPICILPFTINFPGAILCYWVSTNFISLMQVGFLRIPKVRSYFKIEPLVTHNPDNLPSKPKPFVAGIKESWNNMKIAKEIEERQRINDMQFQRAGRGPMIKTYKYDPTKPKASDVSAKKR